MGIWSIFLEDFGGIKLFKLLYSIGVTNNHLFIEFTREKQYKYGHELAVLSDEMSDRGLVTLIEYNNLNNLIPPKSSNEEEEIEEGEDEMIRVIKDTVGSRYSAW